MPKAKKTKDGAGGGGGNQTPRQNNQSYARGKGGNQYGGGNNQQWERPRAGGVTTIGANTGDAVGQEKTLNIQVINQQGEGFLAQTLGYILMHDPNARASLVTSMKHSYPNLMTHGWSPQQYNSQAANQMQQMQYLTQRQGIPAYGGLIANAAPQMQGFPINNAQPGHVNNFSHQFPTQANTGHTVAQNDSKGLLITK